jgi:hypothetical protein
MKATFYVYNPNTGYTRFSHPSQKSAEEEAERLAKQNPGTSFLVLAAISSCISRDIVWDRVDSVCDIPF